MKHKVASVGSALAAPLVFAFYVGLSYRLALRKGKLSFVQPYEWRWDSAYFTLLASGIVAIALIPISRRWVGDLLATSYAAVMGVSRHFS